MVSVDVKHHVYLLKEAGVGGRGREYEGETEVKLKAEINILLFILNDKYSF